MKLALVVPAIIPWFCAANAKLARRGVDLSSLPKLEKEGKNFSTATGEVQPFERILASSGVNAARQRLWVDPVNGDCDLAYNVGLAKRVATLGMSVFLDLHYSDGWADPNKQITPAAWRRQGDIEGLAGEVSRYTRRVCDTFARENITVEVISLGNEIRTGLLWPLGKTPNWGNIARLLQAGSSAVRKSALGRKPKIMIHIDNGWDAGLQKWWFDSVLKGGLKSEAFDTIGVSFYPQYSEKATFSNLRSTLSMLKKNYGKDVMVVETDWPASPCPQVTFPPDMKGIALSDQGQADFMKKLGRVVEEAGGTGLYYWEPGFLGNGALGSKCPDLLMVDWRGKARAALPVFKTL